MLTADAAQTVCQSYHFDASCGSDKVILMTSAQYGRMNVTACVSRDYGYIGCSAEVLEQVYSYVTHLSVYLLYLIILHLRIKEVWV